MLVLTFEDNDVAYPVIIYRDIQVEREMVVRLISISQQKKVGSQHWSQMLLAFSDIKSDEC